MLGKKQPVKIVTTQKRKEHPAPKRTRNRPEMVRHNANLCHTSPSGAPNLLVEIDPQISTLVTSPW